MNKKMNILLFSLFATLLTFGYLTIHHYSLVFGTASTSLCQISQTINCDAAALSSYSELLGIPIALFGLCFSAIILIIILMIRFDWLESTAIVTHSLQILILASVVLSIVLGLISIFKLGVICPLCVVSYILSFINCWLIFKIFKFNLASVSMNALSEHKGFFISLAMIPFLAWFMSSSIQTSYGYDQIIKLIPEKLSQWKQMPVQNFNTELGLIKGDLSSKNTLVEFADFKCSHCKAAADTFKNFSKIQPKIKIIFKPFPLDGNCNPHVSFKGDGSRCQMAGLALCSEKISNQGWAVHDYFFENQEKLSQIADIKPTFKDLSVQLNLNFEEITKCSESSETFDLIRQMTNEAKAAQVEGTPSVFMNNQKLGHGQFLQILMEAYKSLDQ